MSNGVHDLWEAHKGLIGVDLEDAYKNRNKTSSIGVSPDRKKRRCLGPCGEMFVSEGHGNRQCAVCMSKNRKMSVRALHSFEN